MLTIDGLVRRAYEAHASDIHLVCGLAPRYRVDGTKEMSG